MDLLRALPLLAALAAPPCLAWQVENRVVIEHGALLIDHSKSIPEITRAQAQGGFPAEHGLGLFQSRLKTELAIESLAPGVKRLVMTTRIQTSPIIYVAREFSKDSCAYGLVLGHEWQHHLFDLEVLRLLPGEIRAITQEAFPVDELERVGTRNLEKARGHFFQRIKYAYDALSHERHQVIDSPDSYQRLGTQCGGEVARRLAGSG